MTQRIAFGIVLAAGLAGGVACAQEAAPEPQRPEPLRIDQPLYLNCTGDGNSVNTATTAFRDPELSRKTYEGTVEIQLFTGHDRIRPSKGLTTTLALSNNGWYTIKDSNANERVINAITSINLFNTHHIRIDRATGAIEITTNGNAFKGTCQKVDPEAETPKF